MEHKYSSDKELLKACIHESPGARDLFVDEYSKLIHKCIDVTFKKYSTELQKDDSIDLFQDIFLSFFKDDCRKLHQYRGDNNCSVASWLRIIAINITLNFISRRKPLISLDDDSKDSGITVGELPDDRTPVTEILIDAEEDFLYKKAIEELNVQDQLVLKYLYQKGLTPAETAKIMNIETSTVYSKINRIKKKLQEILKSKNLLQ